MSGRELETLREEYQSLMARLNLYSDEAFAWIAEDFGDPKGKEELSGIKSDYNAMMQKLSMLVETEFETVTK